MMGCINKGERARAMRFVHFYLWHAVCESSSSLEAFMLEVVNVDDSGERLLNNRFVFEP